jgi:ribosomal protein S18 acetylase RimI-like enzyme
MQIIHNSKTKKFNAIFNDKIIGYLKYSFPKDASAKNGNRNIQIDYVFVNIAHRRKGLASKLLAHFLKFAKNMVWISLWTGKEAEINKTYSLYKKHGFQQKVVYNDYYEDGIPTRLFVKRILK